MLVAAIIECALIIGCVELNHGPPIAKSDTNGNKAKSESSTFSYSQRCNTVFLAWKIK